jgi:hypothetical protein
MFKKLENNRPFIKMAFQGFAGDGKTYTAVQCAIGLHKQIKSNLPIAIFDTEKASKALIGVFADAGIECVVDDEHRSLKALNEAIAWCENGGADILVIDSITHVWEEYLQTYMTQKRRTRLEFQDWSVIKPQWKKQFSTTFVEAKVHIFFTGRAGYEYETEKDEQTGKREIHKSGIKMKAETETAFEPDILVLMEKHQDLLGEVKKITRVATVQKDRTTRTDGKTFVNPTYEDFKPAFDVFLDGKFKANSMREITDTFAENEERGFAWKKEREILIAEIEKTFDYMKFGTTQEAKALKAAILNKIFGYKSLDALEAMTNEKLKKGEELLKGFAEDYISYMELCAASNEKPENAKISEILSERIANNGLI